MLTQALQESLTILRFEQRGKPFRRNGSKHAIYHGRSVGAELLALDSQPPILHHPSVCLRRRRLHDALSDFPDSGLLLIELIPRKQPQLQAGNPVLTLNPQQIKGGLIQRRLTCAQGLGQCCHVLITLQPSRAGLLAIRRTPGHVLSQAVLPFSRLPEQLQPGRNGRGNFDARALGVPALGRHGIVEQQHGQQAMGTVGPMLLDAKADVIAGFIRILPVGPVMRPFRHQPTRNDASRLLPQPHQINHISWLRLLRMATPGNLLPQFNAGVSTQLEMSRVPCEQVAWLPRLRILPRLGLGRP